MFDLTKLSRLLIGQYAHTKSAQVSLSSVLHLKIYSKKYSSKYIGKVPVIILDHTNFLMPDRSKDLTTLYNQAKDWADERVAQIIFVSSNGATQMQLLGALLSPSPPPLFPSFSLFPLLYTSSPPHPPLPLFPSSLLQLFFWQISFCCPPSSFPNLYLLNLFHNFNRVCCKNTCF